MPDPAHEVARAIWENLPDGQFADPQGAYDTIVGTIEDMADVLGRLPEDNSNHSQH